jgi:hypothetical protein
MLKTWPIPIPEFASIVELRIVRFSIVAVPVVAQDPIPILKPAFASIAEFQIATLLIPDVPAPSRIPSPIAAES